jgi:uncharacterized membrane protein YwaF
VQTFGGKQAGCFISVIPCVHELKNSPESVRAVLFEPKLMCYAFLELALQCVVKVWAAHAQDQPVRWKWGLRFSEIHGHVRVLLVIERAIIAISSSYQLSIIGLPHLSNALPELESCFHGKGAGIVSAF